MRRTPSFAFIVLLCAGVRAQDLAPQRPALALPDSIVIPGRVAYRKVADGAKQFAYYGKAFPVERTEQVRGPLSVTALPALFAKEVYPTPVRHGSIRATSFEGTAQHYGNLSLMGRHAEDWRGWLISGEGELGGGRGHTSGAGWHREAFAARFRRMVSWRTAYEGELLAENGRTGVWGMTVLSRRNSRRIGATVGAERTFSGDNQIRVEVNFQDRRIAAPEMTASEQLIASRLRWQYASGRFWIKGEAKAELMRLARPLGMTGTTPTLVIGVEAWTRPEEHFGGAVGVTIYNTEYLGGDSLKTIRPSVTAWAQLFDVVKFTARLRSGVDRFGIWEAYQSHPMLDVATPLRTSFRSVDLDVNGEIPFGAWSTFTFGLTHRVVRDYPVWKRIDVGNPFLLDYGYAMGQTAAISSFYVRYTHTWARGSADALAIWRTHSLVGQKVPFVPDWEIHLTAQVPLRRTVVLAPAVRVVGPRVFVRPGTSAALGTLGSHTLVDMDVSVPVRGGWMLAFAMRNALNQHYERWDGVSAPGFHLQIGMRRTW